MGGSTPLSMQSTPRGRMGGQLTGGLDTGGSAAATPCQACGRDDSYAMSPYVPSHGVREVNANANTHGQRAGPTPADVEKQRKAAAEVKRLRLENQELAAALRSTADKLGEVSRLKSSQQRKRRQQEQLALGNGTSHGVGVGNGSLSGGGGGDGSGEQKVGSGGVIRTEMARTTTTHTYDNMGTYGNG